MALPAIKKNKMPTMPTNPIDAIAFEWAIRLDRGLCDGEELALTAWLAADLRHPGALTRAKAVLAYALSAEQLPQSAYVKMLPGGDRPGSATGVVPPAVSSGAERRTASGVRRRSLWALAGAALVASVALVMLRLPVEQTRTFQTAVGEVREFTLDDGSSVYLDTATQIEVSYSKRGRAVKLLSGVALFEVAQDALRPFTVRADDFEVEAVGTEFAVRHGSASTDAQLIVSEGIVDVRYLAQPTLRATANTRVTTAPDGRLHAERLTLADVERALMWRKGKIVFHETYLRDVLADFGRYGEPQIRVGDQELMELKITGSFSTDDPTGFAYAFAAAFDLRAIPDGNHIVLRKN